MRKVPARWFQSCCLLVPPSNPVVVSSELLFFPFFSLIIELRRCVFFGGPLVAVVGDLGRKSRSDGNWLIDVLPSLEGTDRCCGEDDD